jgi:hypothetical protein
MGVATRVTMMLVVTTPITVTLSLAFEPEPPPLSGTLIGTVRWNGTPVMGLTMLCALWKGSEDLSIGCMTWTCANGDASLHRLTDQHDA